MTASEIIEQIEALPSEEKAQVVHFVQQMPEYRILAEKQIHYAEPDAVKAAGERIFDRYDELFRKLAQ